MSVFIQYFVTQFWCILMDWQDHPMAKNKSELLPRLESVWKKISVLQYTCYLSRFIFNQHVMSLTENWIFSVCLWTLNISTLLSDETQNASDVYITTSHSDKCWKLSLSVCDRGKKQGFRQDKLAECWIRIMKVKPRPVDTQWLLSSRSDYTSDCLIWMTTGTFFFSAQR